MQTDLYILTIKVFCNNWCANSEHLIKDIEQRNFT